MSHVESQHPSHLLDLAVRLILTFVLLLATHLFLTGGRLPG